MDCIQLINLLIAALALTLATFTFWQINLKPGRLSVVCGSKYGVKVDKDGKVHIYVNVTFQNSGAITVLVKNLRICFADVLVYEFSEIIEALQPIETQLFNEKLYEPRGRAVATSFSVQGHSVVNFWILFKGEEPKGETAGNLEFLASNNKDWQTLKPIPIHFTDYPHIAAEMERDKILLLRH